MWAADVTEKCEDHGALRLAFSDLLAQQRNRTLKPNNFYVD